MKLLLVTLLFLFSLSLHAQEHPYKRIYITYTLKKQDLKPIYAILKKLQIQMFVFKHKNKYMIYSKKYDINNKQINKDYKKIIKKFKYSKILFFNIVKKIQPIKKIEDANISFSSYSFSINLKLGSSQLNTTSEYNFPSDYTLNYGVEFAYFIFKNISLSLGYLNTSTKQTTLNNIYSSLDYNFYPTKDTILYFGILGGYSTLELNNRENSKQSQSSIIGVKYGFSYILNKDINIFIEYNGISMKHIITEDISSAKVTFNFTNSSMLGLGYKF